MNLKKNGLLYIIPVGKYAKSTIEISKNDNNIILPLIEGMPTNHCLIKNIYIGMQVVIIKRTFSWEDSPYMLGTVNIIGRYDKTNWEDSYDVISKETNKKLNIAWNQSYGSRGRNVLDITKDRLNYFVNVSNLKKCKKKLFMSEINNNCDHSGWWTTLKRWNYQSHIPHLQWGIKNSSFFDYYYLNTNSEILLNKVENSPNNSITEEGLNNIENNITSEVINLNECEKEETVPEKNIVPKKNKIIKITKDDSKNKKIVLNEGTIIKIPRSKITTNKYILKSSEIFNLTQKLNDENRNWDLPIIKLLATMDVWFNMTKITMTADNLMWGWRYFVGNELAIQLDRDNGKIEDNYHEYIHLIDKCTSDIEESLKISKSKFKFNKLILGKINYYTKIVRNHIKDVRESIQKTWNDQYKRD